MAHFTKGIESNEKKRILKPYQSESKMYFKLDKTTQQQVLADIRKYTNDFDEKYKLNELFVNNLIEKLSNNSSDEIYRGFLNTPDNTEVIKRVIGKNGYYFHLTTQNCKILFIWHDREKKKFFFWGEKRPLILALKIIHHRILKISNNL